MQIYYCRYAGKSTTSGTNYTSNAAGARAGELVVSGVVGKPVGRSHFIRGTYLHSSLIHGLAG